MDACKTPFTRTYSPANACELAQQSINDIEALREDILTISTYCPNECPEFDMSNKLVTIIEKLLKIRTLICAPPNFDQVIITIGTLDATCYKVTMSDGCPLFICWVHNTEKVFTAHTIEEAKQILSNI